MRVLYRGTSLTKRIPLGPYRRLMPRVLGGSEGGGRFLVSEVPLYPSGGERVKFDLKEVLDRS